jgi:DNA repair protein RecO (recombination protein O)
VTDRGRIDRAQGYVLHAHPYLETSLLVEVFARAHGRVVLIAKGARRPRAALRGVLMAFQPIELGWSGRGEVRTLQRAEWSGGQPLLKGDALLCGFYLNELLLRLLARDDPHEALFDDYGAAVSALARNAPTAPVLRAFERRLLKELGYALTLERDGASGANLAPDALYRYEPERGPVRIAAPSPTDDGPAFTGRALLAIADDDYDDPQTLAQSKQLMRLLINHRLDRQPLHSRRVFRDLQQL